jgi:hypothetical protein
MNPIKPTPSFPVTPTNSSDNQHKSSKTSYHKPQSGTKKWDNPNREVRYDVDKMESDLEKHY